MDVILMEREAFEKMRDSLEMAAKKIEEASSRYSKSKKMQKWLEGNEVCEILNISKRTLQTYRDNGTLSYSQIGYKMYYLADDILAMLNKQLNSSRDEKRTDNKE